MRKIMEWKIADAMDQMNRVTKLSISFNALNDFLIYEHILIILSSQQSIHSNLMLMLIVTVNNSD